MAVFNTGTTGKIHIEDSGSWIYIYLEAGQSQTNSGSLSFSWADPIGSGSSAISYPAGSGKKLAVSLGPFGPGQGGTIYFTLNYTGTSGFGGPTSVSMPFTRASPVSVPSTPGTPAVITAGADRVTLSWTIPANNGAAITEMLLRRSSTSNFASYVDYSNAGNVTQREVTGLDPGGRYYWRVYARNSAGYSNPSGTRTVDQLTGGRRRVAGVWRSVERWRKVDGTWRRVVRWRKVAGVWKRTR